MIKLSIKFLLIIFIQPAFACTLQLSSIDPVNQTTNIFFVNNGGDTEAVFEGNLTVQNVGDNSVKCKFVIALSKGNNNNPNYIRKAFDGTNSLVYQTYSKNSFMTSNIVKELADASDTKNLITGTIKKNNSSISENYYFVMDATVPENANVSQGQYTDNLTAKLYLVDTFNNFQNGVLHQLTNLPINVNVQEYLALELGGTGNNLLIDFAELTTGEIYNFSINIFANTPFYVTVESTNSGVMAHAGIPTATSTVDYDFNFDGSLINLSSTPPATTILSCPSGSACAANAKAKSGALYNSTVTVGNTGSQTSGSYRDDLVLTISNL